MISVICWYDIFRSGSTYAASLVSASEDASYLFEPLFNLERTGLSGWKSGYDRELMKKTEWLIEDLFNCGIVSVNYKSKPERYYIQQYISGWHGYH